MSHEKVQPCWPVRQVTDEICFPDRKIYYPRHLFISPVSVLLHPNLMIDNTPECNSNCNPIHETNREAQYFLYKYDNTKLKAVSQMLTCFTMCATFVADTQKMFLKIFRNI